MAQPVLIQVSTRPHFQASLKNLLGGGRIQDMTDATGSPVPSWLHIDAAKAVMYGTAPENAPPELPLKLRVIDGQSTREVNLLMQIPVRQ